MSEERRGGVEAGRASEERQAARVEDLRRLAREDAVRLERHHGARQLAPHRLGAVQLRFDIALEGERRVK